jgi:predicted GIY-YIG superfamily endonuclease
MTYVRPKPRTKFAGIYGIRHKPSGRMYVGGSTDITGRYTHHRFMLRRGAHKSHELQKLWDRDGEAAFEFVTLERCLPQNVNEREQLWHDTTPNSLNTMKGVTASGWERNSEFRASASRAAADRWARPEYRARQLQRRDCVTGRLLPRADVREPSPANLPTLATTETIR